MDKEKTKANNNKKKFDWKAYGFVWSIIFIPVVIFIYSNVYLNIRTIEMAFTDTLGNWTFNNFKWVVEDMFSESGVMKEALKNTLLFFFTNITFQNFLTLFLSYFLFKRIVGYKVFRVVLYLPVIIGSVAFSIIFKSVVGAGGPIFQIVEKIHGNPIEFFADSRYAIWAILVYTVWVGLGGMIYQGAMARIPNDVFEAAILDGISPLREFFQIIMPLIWPTITTLLILSLAGLFTASGPILLFTGGEFGTMTISYWMWDQIYTYQAYNAAAALGLLLTMIGVPIILVSRNLLFKLQENVEY